MNCTNCSAPLPAKTTRCPFCQTMNDVDLRGQITVKRGQTTRDCPRCKTTLTAVMLGVGDGQVELDRCLSCQGLFFDPGEVEMILGGIKNPSQGVDHLQLRELVEKETPKAEEVTYVPCPDCRHLMHRRAYGQKSGVIIDSCKEHGIWLDGGELRRLIRWTQAGGRQHEEMQSAEKARLDEKLKSIPSTVPPASLPMGKKKKRRKKKKKKDLWDLPDALDSVDIFDLVSLVVRIVT